MCKSVHTRHKLETLITVSEFVNYSRRTAQTNCKFILNLSISYEHDRFADIVGLVLTHQLDDLLIKRPQANVPQLQQNRLTSSDSDDLIASCPI